MKSYLNTAAGIILVISVSTGLQATAAAGAGNDDGLQLRAQSGEITSEIDGANKITVASDIQSQDKTAEMTSPASSELFFEQVRINSKNQAAI